MVIYKQAPSRGCQNCIIIVIKTVILDVSHQRDRLVQPTAYKQSCLCRHIRRERAISFQFGFSILPAGHRNVWLVASMRAGKSSRAFLRLFQCINSAVTQYQEHTFLETKRRSALDSI